MNIRERFKPYTFGDPVEVYKRHTNFDDDSASVLFQSKGGNAFFTREEPDRPQLNGAYAQNNLIALSALEISAKDDKFTIKATSPVGVELLKEFSPDDFGYATGVRYENDTITGTVEKTQTGELSLEDAIMQPNTTFVIRTVLDKFKPFLNYPFAGLYGAFSYDFARNLFDFGNKFERTTPDFKLFLASNTLHYDGEHGGSEHVQLEVNEISDPLTENSTIPIYQPPDIPDYEDMSLDQYEKKVGQIVKDIRNGRVSQCVLSRNYGIPTQTHPFNSYTQLQEINESPYLFFQKFSKDEFLYGASPELHIRLRGNELEIRPIAGTARRDPNPNLDKLVRRALFDSEKDRAEHFMLLDLAKNDANYLAEIASVIVDPHAILEQYPNLYHMVSGVKATIREKFDAIHALLATLPAGTLSGSPKVEAMTMLETELEESSRGFYGGAIGYFLFNGDFNSGITIRSVHARKLANQIYMSFIRSGAGVVADSDPKGERDEIENKIENMIQVVRGF